MQQEIEIEFKNMLTPDEFFRLSNELSLREQSFATQTNYYFDTPDFLLKQHLSALRIREKQGYFVLTLKQPHPEGLLETHQNLSETEYKAFMNGEKFVEGQIYSILSGLGIEPQNVHYLGALTTKRAETETAGGILVLDENQYLSITDYELEYEAKERKQGEADFHRFLQEKGIPERKTLNKIQRFFEAKSSEL
ncbi:CYTH domain-containing protein [Fictibacillus terranigra]|uniref:CYTH domain-containing protein n=1 Tax=Fictibacillus terranigra TaxID=3058424 RepID=A0ABT8E706_9BACL|nr:CYTH domain-containing protein [Fictibacillus sp. CENA-BCM004]MDN4073680.1 CYTH domain-containing protein [Fictibacillus sp. CENA-BCM004]